MKLTDEQQAVVEQQGNAKVNAVAGSGKTSTLIAFAGAHPEKKILYLAFNRSVRLEAQERFLEKGLNHVDVQTAHSLAYRYIVRSRQLELVNTYKAHEILDTLQISSRGVGKQHTYMLASHIKRLAQLFCNHNTPKVLDLDYPSTLRDEQAKSFVSKYYGNIVAHTRNFLAKMDRGEIPITHDFYLKKFQLVSPPLPYDCILFDEGQDASPVMLDVFLRQKGQKIIVGDRHQQIYGWRSAINALEQVDFPTLFLSKSFRFDEEIAQLAAAYVTWKAHLNRTCEIKISGIGGSKKRKTRATLARTNLSLLRKAIQGVEQGSLKHLYFEGNLNSYTYGQEGASLYDVLNLYVGKKRRIRDNLIASMPSFEALQGFVEATEDYELGMMMEIVQEYKSDIPKLLKRLKEAHVADDQKRKADMIFSTVHKCKGMEYDEVFLGDDFMSESDLKDAAKDPTLTATDMDRLAEEVNLLYVAATRTQNTLHLPAYLIPETEGFKVPERIQVEEANRQVAFEKPNLRTGKSRKKKNAHKRWTQEEESHLEDLLAQGNSIKIIAERLGRNPGAIYARIKKLGLYTH